MLVEANEVLERLLVPGSETSHQACLVRRLLLHG
jgi:hypothetical protein